MQLVWYRNDLRLNDHEPMHQALQTGDPVLPVFCFDPRQFAATSFGFPKTGAFRGQFLLESVADLRQSLRQRGCNLALRRGFPEQIIPALAREYNLDTVHFQAEVTSEEAAVETAMEAALAGPGLPVTALDFFKSIQANEQIYQAAMNRDQSRQGKHGPSTRQI